MFFQASSCIYTYLILFDYPESFKIKLDTHHQKQTIDKYQMSRTFLVFVLVLLQAAASQTSYYTPARVFNSYQLFITNTANPGAPLTASHSGSVFTLPLNAVHSNVHHHAVAFSGYSGLGLPLEMSFDLVVVGNSSTQFVLALGVYGSTKVIRLNFALILIGNEGAGAIEAASLNYSCNLYNPTTHVNSSMNTYTTGVTAPDRFLTLLGGFMAKQEASYNSIFAYSTIFSIVGQLISFFYGSGYGTRLTQVSMVLLIFNSRASVIAPPNFITYKSYLYSYTLYVDFVQAASPAHSYLFGYNQKCFLGFRYLHIRPNQMILFDLNYPSPNLNYSIISSGFGSYDLGIMCYQEWFKCSRIDPHCVQCIPQSICTECSPQYYLQVTNTSSTCSLCSDAMQNCLSCSASSGTLECLLCEEGYRAVIGGCTQIVGCAQIDISTQLCISCHTSFTGPANGLCGCQGTSVNDICTNNSGCITPYIKDDGSVSCIFCSVVLKFKSFPVNEQCICKQNYYSIDGKCKEICGDGFNMGQVQCDDGNTINGDGCSSKCSVEVHYRCSKGSQTTASVCKYVGIPLNVTLTSIKKNGDLNQGLFFFAVSPPLLSIKKMDFSSYLQLNCTINETVSAITYDHTGKLMVSVDFSTDLEGMPCSMYLAFNTTIIESSNITLTFDAVSETQPLRIVVNQNELYTIRTIFQAISYTAIVIFFLSLGHKMIGAELITNLQIVCLSNALYDKGYFFFNEIRRLELVCGFWSIFHDESDSDFSPPFSQRVNMTPFFLENILILFVVLIPVTAIFILCKYYLHKKTIEITDVEKPDRLAENTPTVLIRLSCIIKVLYRMLIFPISAGFMLVLMISCHVQSMSFLNSRAPTFPSILSSVSIFLVMLILSNVCSAELIINGSDLSGLTTAKKWYIPLFLMRSLLMSVFFSLKITLNCETLIYIIVVLQGTYFLFIMFGKSYQRALDNIGIVMLEAVTLSWVGLPLAMRFTAISELYELFIVLALQGAILIAITLSFVRLLVYYSRVIRHCLRGYSSAADGSHSKKNKLKRSQSKEGHPIGPRAEEEVMREMRNVNPYSLYNQGFPKGIKVPEGRRTQPELRVWKRKNNRDLNVIRERKDEEGEDPQLTACKQKLREDLIKKRQKELSF